MLERKQRQVVAPSHKMEMFLKTKISWVLFKNIALCCNFNRKFELVQKEDYLKKISFSKQETWHLGLWSETFGGRKAHHYTLIPRRHFIGRSKTRKVSCFVVIDNYT